MTEQELVTLFWGKAGRTEPYRVHPAVFHMLDVGLVARELVIRAPSGALLRLGRELSVLPEQLANALGLLIALHDLGKISPGFQAKVKPLIRDAEAFGFQFCTSDETDHAMTTQMALASRAGKKWGDRTFRALGAHHGSFHGTGRNGFTPPGEAKYGEGLWREARETAIQSLGTCFGLDTQRLESLLSHRKLSAGATMTLAGLTTLSDWIGSDAGHFFPESGRFATLADYLPVAQERAERAVEATGWRRASAKGVVEFGALFEGKTPNPLQRLAGEVAESLSGPGLVLIEAPMGQGKTEAALLLARRCMERFGHQGIYVALPTQATCNQMFGRFGKFLEAGWVGEPLHLHLLHGLASFHDAYDGLPDLPATVIELVPRGLDGPEAEGSEEQETAVRERGVYAAGWFRASKRGLLAPFGVGTLDQALLSVLPVRHMFLRLFGLANKVVILDEAHAYETYTTTLLEELTAWLRELGCTVIILSATLPKEKRQALLEAYTGGKPTLPEASYPRVTWVDAAGDIQARQPAPEPDEIAVAARRYVPPPLELRPWPETRTPAEVEARLALGKRIAASLEPKSAVAWFCNTVASAQETYLLLNALPELAGRVRLLHASLPVWERRQREKALLNSLGRGMPRPPAGEIWVCTQVLEQSLDVDFDGMVSELAPIDLLLQRAGREHRHERIRPVGFRERVLWWLYPAASEASEETPSFGVDALIYQGHPLLRTLALLQQPRVVETDVQIEELVEAVYGGQPVEMPEVFRSLEATYAEKWEKLRRGETLQGLLAAIRRPTHEDPFQKYRLEIEDEDPKQAAAVQPATRLGDPTITVVCAMETPEGLRVVAEEQSVDPHRAPADKTKRREWERTLLLGSVRLQHRSWVDYLAEQAPPSAWKDSAALRNCRLVTFRNGIAMEGPTELRLHPVLGLVRAPRVLTQLRDTSTAG